MKNKYILIPVLAAALLAFPGCEQEPLHVTIALEAEDSGVLEAIRGTDKSLSEKLILIENAQGSGLTSFQGSLKLMEEALASLKGSLEEKLEAISGAVSAQGTSFQTKLELLEAALSGGFTSDSQTQELLGKALDSLCGTVEEKLTAVETAVKSELSLVTKMALIEQATGEGFPEDYQKQKLIGTALTTLSGSLEEKLAAIESALSSRTSGLETKLGLIAVSMEHSLRNAETAIRNLKKTLEEGLSDLSPDFTVIVNQIISKLQTIAGKMAPETFSKSFQGILNSLQGNTQSTETLLKKLQEAVDDLAAEVIP